MKHGEIVTQGIPKEVLTSKTIEEIYEIQADIIEQNGVLHILYQPGGKTKLSILSCNLFGCKYCMHGCFMPQSVL